ncbi:MAG: ABC transporter permease subunit [Hyphomicrobium sp.]
MSVGAQLEPRNNRLPIAAALFLTLVAATFYLPWASQYPSAWTLPLSQFLTSWLNALVAQVSFVTRAFAQVAEAPLVVVTSLLVKGAEITVAGHVLHLPPLSWAGVCGAFIWLGYWGGGMRLAALQIAGCAYLLLFGQWDAAMLTLASVLVCVPIAVIVGLLLGVIAHLRPPVNQWVLSPALDIMQTVPAFAYLIPTLLLFGFGPVAAMLTTVIFAAPPMARVTTLVLDRAPSEIRELATMIGCSRAQAIWRVLLPSQAPTLLVGLNQTVMMTLNMVIIASMIGAGGLGFDVLRSLRQLDIDRGFISGGAIVVLAIMLDRLSATIATRVRPDASHVATWAASPLLPLAWLLATTLIATQVTSLATFPTELRLSTGGAFNALVGWINVNYFDAMETLRVFTVRNLMNPIKFALADTPWLLLAGGVTLAAYLVAGVRLALLSALVLGFCLVTGLWDKVMITLYLCLSATFISAMIGIQSPSSRHATTCSIAVPIFSSSYCKRCRASST